jgi:hypothetical protein
MAERKKKVTFTLFEDEIQALRVLAERRRRSQSVVVGMLALDEFARAEATAPKRKSAKQAA